MDLSLNKLPWYAQVGLFVAYASEKGAAFVDHALYLPREEWADDPVRRKEAGVPDEVRFATKGELAKEMLKRAFEAGVPARWVVADTVYGTARGLRGWLEEQGCFYVLGVTGTHGVYHEGHQRRARTVAKRLPQEAWFQACVSGCACVWAEILSQAPASSTASRSRAPV